MRVDHYLDFIKRHVPSLDIGSVEENNQGWDNDVLIINQEWLFRFPKRHEIALKLEREKVLLDHLRHKTDDIQIPNYLLINNEQGIPMCCYYKVINGKQLEDINSIPKDQMTSVARQVGRFLTELHHTELAKMENVGFTIEQTQSYWEVFYSNIKRDVFPFLNKAEQRSINQMFDHLFNSILTQQEIKTMIHGDLSSDHIIYDSDHACISGIIDFGDAQIGDPAYDFAGLYNCYGSHFVHEVLRFYKLKEPMKNLLNRVEAFYSKQSVFHNILYAIAEDNDSLLNQSLIELRKR